MTSTLTTVPLAKIKPRASIREPSSRTSRWRSWSSQSNSNGIITPLTLAPEAWALHVFTWSRDHTKKRRRDRTLSDLAPLEEIAGIHSVQVGDLPEGCKLNAFAPHLDSTQG
jgi:hypothetical protein